jgi:transcription termination factor 2
MGQRRDVFVHKFVCRDTVEERILDIQRKKRELAQDLLAVGNKLRNKSAYKAGLSMKELMRILES